MQKPPHILHMTEGLSAGGLSEPLIWHATERLGEREQGVLCVWCYNRAREALYMCRAVGVFGCWKLK